MRSCKNNCTRRVSLTVTYIPRLEVRRVTCFCVQGSKIGGVREQGVEDNIYTWEKGVTGERRNLHIKDLHSL
jgi:hypothetical protein